MNKKTNTTTHYGINFLELLALVFIVLKLCKIIAWPWVWVLSPIWIGWILAIIIYIIIVLVLRK